MLVCIGQRTESSLSLYVQHYHTKSEVGGRPISCGCSGNCIQMHSVCAITHLTLQIFVGQKGGCGWLRGRGRGREQVETETFVMPLNQLPNFRFLGLFDRPRRSNGLFQ